MGRVDVAFSGTIHPQPPHVPVNALAKVIEKYPVSSEAGDAYYWIGYLLRSATAYKQAAETYDKLIEKFSQKPKKKNMTALWNKEEEIKFIKKKFMV